ncbi:non-histone chromosomal protein HMG-14-like [Choloepus didactylus]|uniref:non-histone chromosomal protein HMG-14-like n=1 Tax=Choloepus didactylus TaxID=27675 RepID=UPI00189D7C51|nr:non-histone chromosomal protein HMG-14-like [Choloepus didactylus]
MPGLQPRRPKFKVGSVEGARSEEPKWRSVPWSAKPELTEKVETKPTKPAGEDGSSDKKVQPKGKGRAKGKQAKVAYQETNDLLAENGETKKEEDPASDEGKKEAKCD